MARFTIELPEDLHREFRIRVIELFGTEKGAITKATVEAIRMWLRQREPAIKRK
jgi:hypothetical protein